MIEVPLEVLHFGQSFGFVGMQPMQLTFDNDQTAVAVQVTHGQDLPVAIEQLQLPIPAVVLVVVGGASGLTAETLKQLQFLFIEVLCPIVEKAGLTVIDGGTDAGVMQLMGQARAKTGSTFPLVGVVTLAKAILPQAEPIDADAAPLEPNHTHFLLVPGRNWGDESAWIAEVAEILAGGKPSATILINGGLIALNQDVPNSLEHGRPVLVISGSGRSADQIAAAIEGQTTDPQTQELVDSGLIYTIDMAEGIVSFGQALQQVLAVS